MAIKHFIAGPFPQDISWRATTFQNDITYIPTNQFCIDLMLEIDYSLRVSTDVDAILFLSV